MPRWIQDHHFFYFIKQRKGNERYGMKNDLDSFIFTHCRQDKVAKVLMYAIYELHLISSSDMLMNIWINAWRHPPVYY